ncbi:MAG: nitrite reductase/ring-hydroxylating ferredoxin subunit [Gammaproteobacteria bacterium]|jgi:phenylpropionate dioxygenase-like ring-hydroxylating dioxygenase large terminal subunit
MQHELQVELSQELLHHIDAGTTTLSSAVAHNLVSHFTCPSWLAAERAQLFRDLPLFLGLSCRAPSAGDYFTEDAGEAPLLIVRGEDGVLRGFMNVCRHRGARVAEGCGHAARFSCPYHGWTYGKDGTLLGIPDRTSFPGVEMADHALTPISVTEHDGMIWARAAPANHARSNAGPAPLDMATALGGLNPELREYGFGTYHHYETRQLTQKMNWKLVIDTFLEPYHFAVLHRETVAPIFFSNLCLFHPFSPHLRETIARRSIVGLKDLPTEQWDLVTHSAIVYVLFPNTVLIMQADHVETWRVYPHPTDPNKCSMYLDFYIPEPATTERAREHWDRNMDLTIRTVVEEDFPTSEGMQSGFHCAAQSEVTYGRNEPALAYFEQQISERVNSPLSAPDSIQDAN